MASQMQCLPSLLLQSTPRQANFLISRGSFVAMNFPARAVVTKRLSGRPNILAGIPAARHYSSKKDNTPWKKFVREEERRDAEDMMKEIQALRARDPRNERPGEIARRVERLQCELDYHLGWIYVRESEAIKRPNSDESIQEQAERWQDKEKLKGDVVRLKEMRQPMSDLWTLKKKTVQLTMLAPMEEVSIPNRLEKIVTCLGVGLLLGTFRALLENMISSREKRIKKLS